MLFRKFILSLWAVGVVLFFPSPASAYMGGVCLHPLEQMALFSGGTGKSSGKSSYKSQIRRLNKSLRAIDRRIDKQKNKLKRATEALGNSLSGQLLGDDPDDVADSITDYIQDEQNGWNCREDGGTGGSVYLYPNFLPGIFGSLLPLLLESTPTYAAPLPLGRIKKKAEQRKLAQQKKAKTEKKKLDKQKQLRQQAKRFCERKWGAKEVTKAVPTPRGYPQCYCRWDGPGGRSSLLCEQIKKAKKNVQKGQLKNCRTKFPVPLEVTGVKGTQCYCKLDNLQKKVKCETVETQKKKRTEAQITECRNKHENFQSLGKNNVCMCVSKDASGKSADVLVPCENPKKPVNTNAKIEQCKEDPNLKGLEVTGVNSFGRCLCKDLKAPGKSSLCSEVLKRRGAIATGRELTRKEKKENCKESGGELKKVRTVRKFEETCVCKGDAEPDKDWKCPSQKKPQQALEQCKERYKGLNVSKAVPSGPQNKYTQCICRWDGPGKKKTILCTELEKIQKGAKDRKAMEICRKRHKKAKITRAVTTGRGTYCYCGTQSCGAVYSKCKKEYEKGFTHIDSKNDCVCRTPRRGKGHTFSLCKEIKKKKEDRKKEALEKKQAMKLCHKTYGSSAVTGIKSTPEGPECYCGTSLCSAVQDKCKKDHKAFRSLGKNNACICRWDGPGKKKTILCTELEKIQKGAQGKNKAMGICRKRHKEAKITRAVTTGRGTYCYCGGNKLCHTIYAQCKTKYGKKGFTHIDSENDCMCGSELCKDKALGSKLQKCIDKNRDIFSGVTIKGDICMCGKQSCDQLRGILSRKCKQYEGVGYTEFKNGHCMCGNKKCKDKKEGQKSVDPRCFKKFPGLTIIESLYAPNRRLQCICLHKGTRINCGRIKNKPEESKEPAEKQPPRITYQKKYKECKDKYEGKPGIKAVILYNRDKDKCVCRFDVDTNSAKQTGFCDNPPPQTSGGGDTDKTPGGGSDDEGKTPGGDNPIELVPPDDSGTKVDPDPESPAVAEAAQQEKKPCKKWQKKKYFGRKGRVRDSSFCSDFASGKKNCRDAFDDIRKEIEKLSKLKERRKKREKSLSEWEDKKFDAQFSEDEDEDSSEVGGLCIKCLADLRRATGPTGWQRFGSGLSVALGTGLSIFGLREARRSQHSTNELLALQGMPAENNFGYSLAGLSLGYPFVARGLHGLTHGNTPNFACNRHPSPYPHPYPTYPMFY